MKLIKSKTGFTLVEMIIVIAVAAMILTPFGMMLTSGLRNEVNVQRTIDADQTTQQTFIVLNEKIRARGFNSIEIIDDHYGVINAVKVDDVLFFRNNNGYVSQTYDATKLLPDTENIINPYVLSATATIYTHDSGDDLSDYIEIVFSVDTDNDGIENNSYTFKYAKRR